jgi:hypothetical protein
MFSVLLHDAASELGLFLVVPAEQTVDFIVPFIDLEILDLLWGQWWLNLHFHRIMLSATVYYLASYRSSIGIVVPGVPHYILFV